MATIKGIKAGTLDITVSYSDSSVSKSSTISDFTVGTIDLSSMGDVSAANYSGSAITPTPNVYAVVNGSSRLLAKDTDYTLSYSNNTNAGTNTAKVTATGKGNYSGSVSVNFTINKAPNSLSIDKTSATIYSTSGYNTTVIKYGATYQGTISAVSSDTSKATVSLNTTTREVTVTYKAAGSVNIDISAAGNSNYNSSTLTCAVTCTADSAGSWVDVSVNTYGTPTVSIGSGFTASNGSATVTCSVNDTWNRKRTYTSGYVETGTYSKAGTACWNITNQYIGSASNSTSGDAITRFSPNGTAHTHSSVNYYSTGASISHSTMGASLGYDIVVVTAYNHSDLNKTATASTYVLNDVSSTGPSSVVSSGVRITGITSLPITGGNGYVYIDYFENSSRVDTYRSGYRMTVTSTSTKTPQLTKTSTTAATWDSDWTITFSSIVNDPFIPIGLLYVSSAADNRMRIVFGAIEFVSYATSPVYGTITATYNGKTATHEIVVCDRITNITLDTWSYGSSNTISSFESSSIAPNISRLNVTYESGATSIIRRDESISSAGWIDIPGRTRLSVTPIDCAYPFITAVDSDTSNISVSRNGGEAKTQGLKMRIVVPPEQGGLVKEFYITLTQTDGTSNQAVSYTVINQSSTYGFVRKNASTSYKNSTVYYESNNQRVGDSAASCLVKVKLRSDQTSFCIYYISSGQSGYDFGVVSQVSTSDTFSLGSPDSIIFPTSTYWMSGGINKTLLTSSKPISGSMYKVLYLGLTAGGTYYVSMKYRKNASTDSQCDSLRFRVEANSNTPAATAILGDGNMHTDNINIGQAGNFEEFYACTYDGGSDFRPITTYEILPENMPGFIYVNSTNGDILDRVLPTISGYPGILTNAGALIPVIDGSIYQNGDHIFSSFGWRESDYCEYSWIGNFNSLEHVNGDEFRLHGCPGWCSEDEIGVTNLVFTNAVNVWGDTDPNMIFHESSDGNVHIGTYIGNSITYSPNDVHFIPDCGVCPTIYIINN